MVMVMRLRVDNGLRFRVFLLGDIGVLREYLLQNAVVHWDVLFQDDYSRLHW